MRTILEELDSPVELIDSSTVDWDRVRRTAYLVDQVLRYEYEGPVENLRQRLVVFPPRIHGTQRLLGRHLQVSSRQPLMREKVDRFGNHVSTLVIPHIERVVEFEIRFLVEQNRGYPQVPLDQMDDPAYLELTPLTQPDLHLSDAAEMVRGGDPTVCLADRINEWVWRTMAYTRGVTNTTTTAAEAFAQHQGVCQDYSHIMLSICRQLGLPARYVSGHLLGEGATHAWVEVLAPDPINPEISTVQAYDPTHGRRCRPDYITVAVGRDYSDVAPTSGTYIAPHSGRLISRKLAGITDIDYFPTEAA